MNYNVDIGSHNSYPGGALSNFSPHPFIFNGLQVNSMEGFLQGLKFKSIEMQQYVFTLVGFGAKKKGSSKKWFKTQTLYYQGQPFYRHSQEYQNLLDEAYYTMFTQNEKAKKALLATQKAVLRHSLGKSDSHKTVLTEQEFCSRLTKIRERLRNDML